MFLQVYSNLHASNADPAAPLQLNWGQFRDALRACNVYCVETLWNTKAIIQYQLSRV